MTKRKVKKEDVVEHFYFTVDDWFRVPIWNHVTCAWRILTHTLIGGEINLRET